MITLSDLDKISDCHIDQYIIFDLETSGVSTTENRIISAEALLIKDGKVIGEFRRLANPGFMLSPEIIEIVGISNAELSGAPETDLVIDQLMSFIGDNLCISYSALFDNKFLMAELELKGQVSCPTILCLERTSRYLFPDLAYYSSDAIAASIGWSDVSTLSGRLDYVARFAAIFQALDDRFSALLSGRRPVVQDYIGIHAFI